MTAVAGADQDGAVVDGVAQLLQPVVAAASATVAVGSCGDGRTADGATVAAVVVAAAAGVAEVAWTVAEVAAAASGKHDCLSEQTPGEEFENWPDQT